MKIWSKNKNFEDYEDIEDDKIEEEFEYEDYEERGEVSRDTIIKDIRYFLENYDKLANKDYYRMICNFYNIKLEDSDYINYINKSGNNFYKIIKINTDVIDGYQHVEGHGKDLSWWIVKVRLSMKIAVSADLENPDRYFKIDEIKQLIQEGKIYPIDYFYEECDDRLYLNKVKNDIDYLIKYEHDRKNGQLLVDDEYFDYFMKDIIDRIDLNYIFMCIRKTIISNKIYLECCLKNCYFDDEEVEKQMLDEVNELIDSYNRTIYSLSFDNASKEENKLKLISKNSVEIVIEYLDELPKVDKNEWYQDIEIEQIVQILESIDNNNIQLCKKIEKIIIDLGDPELCFMIASNYVIDWIDFDKMIEIIINSRDENVCYEALDSLWDIDDNIKRKFIKIIVDSCDVELNYKTAQLDLPYIDVLEHGRVIIESKSVWYNFLFAQLEGADVRGHGEVIIESRDTYYNSIFPSYVHGADVDRHRQVVIKNKDDLEEEKSLKKKRVKN